MQRDRNLKEDEPEEISRQIREKLQGEKDVPPFQIRAFYESSLEKVSREFLKEDIEISYEKLPDNHEYYGDMFRPSTYTVTIFNWKTLTSEIIARRSIEAEKKSQQLSLEERYKIFLRRIDIQTRGTEQVFKYYMIPLNLISPDFLDFLQKKEWRLQEVRIGETTYWRTFW